MKRKNFTFTNKKHSNGASMSAILGSISLLSMIIVICLAYQKGGETPHGYGMTGLFSTVFSLIGLCLGLLTLKNKENYRLFPWLGTIINGLVLIGIGFVLYFGRI